MRENKAVKRSRQSVKNIGVVIGIVVAICVANVLFTMVTGYHFRSGKNVKAYKSGSGTTTTEILANRGNIYDCNKEVIAQDIESYNLYAVIDPERINAGSNAVYVEDYDKTAEELAPILGCSASIIKKYLTAAKEAKSYQTEFGAYGKSLTADQKAQIEALNLPGLDFSKSTSRVYPTGTFASQMIGYSTYNSDTGKSKGVMGIEKNLNKYLSGTNGEVTYQTSSAGSTLPNTKKITKTSENGDDIYLTLDKNVQVVVEQALKDTMENNGATLSFCVVMEAKTGKILAQAGYPTFDLNTRETISNYYNVPSEFAFECGSVMKIFTYASAMDAGVYNGAATFSSGSATVGYDSNGKLVRIDSGGSGSAVATVNDAQGHNYGVISFDEGLIRSCNTGIVSLLTGYLDPDKFLTYLDKFGFFKPVGIKGVSESAGVKADSDELSKVVSGFGQSSTVTCYQLLQAASTIMGNGQTIKPYVVDKIVNPNTGQTVYQGKTVKSKNKVVSTEACKQVRALMRQIVEADYGTAHHYQMSDISFIAKTGTGQIATSSGYSSSNFTTSIMAGAPADDPEVIVYYGFQSTNIISYNVSYFQSVMRAAIQAEEGYKNNTTATDSTSQTTTTTPTTTYDAYTMPNLVNHTLDYANNKLQNYNVNKVIIGDGNSIIKQYPGSGTTIFTNENIFLLTDGTNITMPNMTGWSRRDVSIFAKLIGMDVVLNGSGNVTNQSIGVGETISSKNKLTVELK